MHAGAAGSARVQVRVCSCRPGVCAAAVPCAYSHACACDARLAFLCVCTATSMRVRVLGLPFTFWSLASVRAVIRTWEPIRAR